MTRPRNPHTTGQTRRPKTPIDIRWCSAFHATEERVLRYPRMLSAHGLSEKRIYDYVGFLREAAEIVVPNPLMVTPIRDVNDTVVM
jgi:hypothetical protein